MVGVFGELGGCGESDWGEIFGVGVVLFVNGLFVLCDVKL